MPMFRFAGRGLWIGIAVLLHLLLWSCGWLVLLVTLQGKAARQAWFASRFAALLIALGATFVKVGQIMSTRPDLIPPHIIRALTRLQDNVGAFDWRHVEGVFVEELGASPDELFASFDHAPVASASVAQVHRATLRSGEEVAVNVRRPGLDDLVRIDLAMMRIVAQLIALVPSIRLLAPVESIDEFARSILAQIDLHDVQRRDRGDRGHRQAARSEPRPRARSTPDLRHDSRLWPPLIAGRARACYRA
ncbi:MAG: AarF/ABC1/UbiB kinase family protein [Deltaproteobacteria bacterium]|nr:AarF/ABC1/UbiB kinase family protein [Deltaproteobacteria bacterium]